MADLRHVLWSKEPFGDMIDYAEYIHHIHMDYPSSYPERKYPRPDDDFDYSGFLNALKESKYDDTLTVEADIPGDWEKAHKQAMEVLGGILGEPL